MIRFLLGLLLLAVPFGIFALVVRLWPLNLNGQEAADPYQFWTQVWPCNVCNQLAFEARMLLIVLLAGALGSAVHVATSYASFVGNRRFVDSWGWWYILRLPIGMGLAIILYFALRGGFFTPVTNDTISAQQVVNPFGFAAIAALAGMFSKQATDKMKELFDGLFRTDEDSYRGDKLEASPPTIKSIAPATIKVGQTNARLVIKGTDFHKNSVVKVNDKARPTSFIDGTSLEFAVEAADVAQPGTLAVTVVNHENEGGRSEAANLVVSQP